MSFYQVMECKREKNEIVAGNSSQYRGSAVVKVRSVRESAETLARFWNEVKKQVLQGFL